MPTITKILEQKRTPARRTVFLDGRYAFPCSLATLARFRLRVGQELSELQIQQILLGQTRQECFDKATQFLARRLHSRAELHRKLLKSNYPADLIDAVLNDLSRLGYVDDQRFANTKALYAAQHKHQGRRRAFMELLRAGIQPNVANRALDDVYQLADSTSIAQQLIQKHLPRLRKLDPLVARRRLLAMLQRRGFDYDAVRTIIDQSLPTPDDSPEP